jgi:hypothetical protein
MEGRGGQGNRWDVIFMRAPGDQEMTMLVHLVTRARGVQVMSAVHVARVQLAKHPSDVQAGLLICS